MAINIPNRPTLMDHLANIGSRYVENKALTDRQRMQQEFLMDRDEQNQAFQSAMAEDRNQLLKDQITLEGEQNRLLAEANMKGQTDIANIREGGATSRTQLTTDAQKGIVSTQEHGLNTRFKAREGGETLRHGKQMANDLSIAKEGTKRTQLGVDTQRYLADLGSKTQLQLANDLNTLNLKLAEMNSEDNYHAMISGQAAAMEELKVAIKGKLDAISTQGTQDQALADIQGGYQTADTALRVGGQQYGADTQKEIALNQIGSNERMQGRQIDFQQKTMADAIVNQQLEADKNRQFQKTFQSNEHRFQAGESAKSYDFQAQMNETDDDLKKVQIKHAEFALNEMMKDPNEKFLQELEPILEANGISKEQFLSPEKDGRIMGSIKALLNGAPLAAIANLALRYNLGYDNEFDRVDKVNTAIGKVANYKMYNENPDLYMMNNMMSQPDE